MLRMHRSSRTAPLQTVSRGSARHIWSFVLILYTTTVHVRACGYLGGITQRLLNAFMH
jgi:transposase